MALIGTQTSQELAAVVAQSLPAGEADWLKKKLEGILEKKSARELFLTYSLVASKIGDTLAEISRGESEVLAYLSSQRVTHREIARMYLLTSVLAQDREFYSPRVAKLIEVADKSELETFLRFLPLLPHAADFKQAAVEALRTNIATVFDAIALDNPYPAEFFNDQQWNQMYLKAAFMQRDLSRIPSVDVRANAGLARIISDYAHERWAASRKVDPLFWRPVGGFVNDAILKDMKRLLESDDVAENRAGALCCFRSDNPEAAQLLENYPQLKEEVRQGNITWENLNNQ